MTITISNLNAGDEKFNSLLAFMDGNDITYSTKAALPQADVIRSAIGDDNYNCLARLIQLHEMLNDGTGLSHDEYDEHEQLVESLDDILPLH